MSGFVGGAAMLALHVETRLAVTGARVDLWVSSGGFGLASGGNRNGDKGQFSATASQR